MIIFFLFLDIEHAKFLIRKDLSLWALCLGYIYFLKGLTFISVNNALLFPQERWGRIPTKNISIRIYQEPNVMYQSVCRRCRQCDGHVISVNYLNTCGLCTVYVPVDFLSKINRFSKGQARRKCVEPALTNTCWEFIYKRMVLG